jgi:hypothetical protein
VIKDLKSQAIDIVGQGVHDNVSLDRSPFNIGELQQGVSTKCYLRLWGTRLEARNCIIEPHPQEP